MIREFRVYKLIVFVFVFNLSLLSQNIELKKHISFLSSDSLEGRLIGSKGELIAANYIENYFKNLKLQPFTHENYFQEFTYNYIPKPNDSSNYKSLKGLNVVAYLNNNSEKTIVIGAHYDHIGLNEFDNSLLANSKGQIHNGADDNASGVAAVLELSRLLSTNKKTELVNFIFVCFSGEEEGLIGSKFFVKELLKTNTKVVSMINMDMIGRMDSVKNLYVGGIGTSPSFNPILIKNKPKSFKLNKDSSGIGPSDHSSFYLQHIPVLFFYTGTHMDYHKPSDDEDKINYKDLDVIINYIFNLINDLSKVKSIEFHKTKDKANSKATKYKVTLGIMPSYSDFKDGLHIDGVIENKPAMLSGIEAGDIIIQLGDCKINNIYSYMECLSKYNKADTTTVTIIRKGVILKKEVVF
jgi:hypothetical protein